MRLPVCQLPVYRSGSTGPAVVLFVSIWSVECMYASGAGIAVHIKGLAESFPVKSVLLPDESYETYSFNFFNYYITEFNEKQHCTH